MIATMILFSIAGTTLLWSIITSSVTDNENWLLALIITLICSFAGVGILYNTPTNKDVKKGKAHYVEQNHIEVVNGDTINTYKTYQIEWNQNTK
jgi:hypothetical protein